MPLQHESNNEKFLQHCFFRPKITCMEVLRISNSITIKMSRRTIHSQDVDPQEFQLYFLDIWYLYFFDIWKSAEDIKLPRMPKEHGHSIHQIFRMIQTWKIPWSRNYLFGENRCEEAKYWCFIATVDFLIPKNHKIQGMSWMLAIFSEYNCFSGM